MKKYSLFLIVSVILCFLFLKLLLNYSVTFKNAENSAINLTKGVSADKIRDVLLLQGYVEKEQDADFIAQQLVDKLNSKNNIPPPPSGSWRVYMTCRNAFGRYLQIQ